MTNEKFETYMKIAYKIVVALSEELDIKGSENEALLWDICYAIEQQMDIAIQTSKKLPF